MFLNWSSAITRAPGRSFAKMEIVKPGGRCRGKSGGVVVALSSPVRGIVSVMSAGAGRKGARIAGKKRCAARNASAAASAMTTSMMPRVMLRRDGAIMR